MHVIVLGRTFLARHRWVHWAVVLALALAVAAGVEARLDSAQQAHERWAQTSSVLVAARDLAPGEIAETTRTEFPLVAVPRSAVAEVPPGARVRRHVGQGEVIVDADVTTVDGPAALAGSGTLVVGLVDPNSPGTAAGQRVRVAADGVTLADDAMVVAVVDTVAFVAVDERSGPAVAAAAHAGIASLMFVP